MTTSTVVAHNNYPRAASSLRSPLAAPPTNQATLGLHPGALCTARRPLRPSRCQTAAEHVQERDRSRMPVMGSTIPEHP